MQRRAPARASRPPREHGFHEPCPRPARLRLHPCSHRLHLVKALTIRDVDGELARALEREKKRRGSSLNQTVLQLLRQALGLDTAKVRSNSLGKLAGTWSKEDLSRFERDTAVFEQVDEELWKR